jgi:hypothetical protein
VLTLVEPQPPYFVMAQGEVFIGPELARHFVQQHEHTMGLPALTTWGIAALALVLLVAGFVVIRRARRAPVAM